MGRYVRKKGDDSSVQYWYPGQRVDWVQAAISIGSGLAAAVVVRVATGSALWAAAIGFSVSAGLAGVYLGRRDAQSLDVTGANRLKGFALIGLAFLRALAKGAGAALAALVVVAFADSRFWAQWVLPLAPAVVGAIAHHFGMLYQRLEKASAVAVKASESTIAKAAAERRESLATAPVQEVFGTDHEQAQIADEATAVQPVGEYPEGQPPGVGVGMAASLPGEVEDTAWREYAGVPYRETETAYHEPGLGSGDRPPRVYSRRRPA